MTRVLPLPAPANSSKGPWVVSTARRCWGLRLFKSRDMAARTGLQDKQEGNLKHMEFVAPAGNLEKLKIALAYGAKAIYLAGQRFGLRSGADNFSLAELSQATALCRAQGAKLYLAINAMLLDEELAALPEYLQEIKP